MPTLDRILDALPRTRFGCFTREIPAFRACGVTGFYVAVLTLLAGGIMAGRSPLVLAGLAGVCAVSFFVYALLRKWITGRETLVLLEHVWFALATVAAWLWLFEEPMLPYLDAVAVALCPFLAAGRIGCTLVGCCHGRPSRVGIVYPESCAADGFPRHLVGVRLFPVPAIEAIALAAIGVGGLCALPFAAPGRVLVWFLLAYAVVRFGLEGIRGDKRPHLLGLSQARWMALAEVAVVLAFGESAWPVAVGTFALLTALLVLAVVLTRRWNLAAKLLTAEHLAEVRTATLAAREEARLATSSSPIVKRTKMGVGIALSANEFTAHVSFTLPGMQSDLPLLCALACRAFPELEPDDAEITRGRVLHFTLPWQGVETVAPALDASAERTLYGVIVRRLQNPIPNAANATTHDEPRVEPAVERRTPAPSTSKRKPWWFSTNGR